MYVRSDIMFKIKRNTRGIKKVKAMETEKKEKKKKRFFD